jgi:hypothetical protein
MSNNDISNDSALSFNCSIRGAQNTTEKTVLLPDVKISTSFKRHNEWNQD